jgi:hypothetical protein
MLRPGYHNSAAGAADLIAVLRVGDGKVGHWREYQGTPATAQAKGA